MMSCKVLYIEDDPFLARLVCDGLQGSGYKVTWIMDGNLAQTTFNKLLPDICVLDIMLQKKDGYTISKEIREANPLIPIIFLSAQSLTTDVVKGFKSGGNDYLKKPFSMEELLARMESLLARYKPKEIEPSGPVYHFGKCSLDIVHQILKTSLNTYQLTFKESQLLEMLVQHQSKVLDRQFILKKIWGNDGIYNARSMDVFMTQLRKYLKSEPEIQILNLRSIGYKFLCA